MVPLTRKPGLHAVRDTIARLPGDMAAFRDRISPGDILLFLLFPVLITAVEILSGFSPPLRDLLQLHYADPRWLQPVTWAFVHAGPGHCLDNLASYLVIGAVGLVLAADLRDTRLFFLPLGIMAILIPLADAAFKVFLLPSVAPALFGHPGTASGSSGIIAGLLGLLPLLWLLVLSRLSGRDLLDQWSVYLVLSYVPFALVMAYQPGVNLPTLVVIAAAAALALVSWGKGRCILAGLRQASTGNLVTWIAITLAPVLYLVLPFTLFPRELVHGTTLVDFAGHYLGLVIGVVTGAMVMWFLKGAGEKSG